MVSGAECREAITKKTMPTLRTRASDDFNHSEVDAGQTRALSRWGALRRCALLQSGHQHTLVGGLEGWEDSSWLGGESLGLCPGRRTTQDVCQHRCQGLVCGQFAAGTNAVSFPLLHSSSSGTATFSHPCQPLHLSSKKMLTMSTTTAWAARSCCKAPVATSRTAAVARPVRPARAQRRYLAASPSTARNQPLVCRAELPASAEDAPLAKAAPPSGEHTHVLPPSDPHPADATSNPSLLDYRVDEWSLVHFQAEQSICADCSSWRAPCRENHWWKNPDENDSPARARG